MTAELTAELTAECQACGIVGLMTAECLDSSSQLCNDGGEKFEGELSALNTTAGEKCEDGYEGFLCVECNAGWYSAMMNALGCKTCPNTTLALACYLLIPAGLYLFALVMSRKKISGLHHKRINDSKTVDALGRGEDILSPSFKILVTHATVLLVVLPADWEWKGTVVHTLSASQAPAGSVLDLDTNCAFGWGFKGKVWFHILAPLAGAAVALLGGIVLSRVRKEYSNVSTTIHLLASNGLYLFSASTICNLMIVYPCYFAADSYRMVYDPARPCGSHIDLIVASTLAIVCYTSLALYVLVYQLYNRKHIIMNLAQSEDRISQSTSQIYGFLFHGFIDKYYFWEMTVVLRKLLTYLAAIWFPPATNMTERCLTLLFVIVTSLLVTARCRPYELGIINILDSVTQAASLSSVVLALYVTAIKNSSNDMEQGSTAKTSFATLLFILINLLIPWQWWLCTCW